MQSRLLLLILTVLIFSQHTFSQAGTPDSSFGVNGVVSISIPLKHKETYLYANYITQQKDGKFIVLITAHRLNPGFFSNGYIYRFKNNGSVDSSFGVNGRISIYSGKRYFSFHDLIIDSGDNIIFSKSIYEDINNVFEVVRLNKNGRLDYSL